MTDLLLEPIQNAWSTRVLSIANSMLRSASPTGSTSMVIAGDADESWFLSEAWQSGERAVDAHVARGEVQVFDDADGLLSYIDRLAGEA